MKLPDDIKAFFITENLYKKIGDCECIYNEKLLNEYLSFLTEMDNYRKIESECKEVEDEIKHLKSISRIDFLEVQRTRKTDQVESCKHKLGDKKTLKEHTKYSISEIESEISILHTIISGLTTYDEVKTDLERLTQEKEKVTELSEKMTSVAFDIRRFTSEKNELTEQVFKKESNIEKYKEYMKNLEENRLVYEDYTNLKFSLSGTTGIPLEHIRLYFKEVREIANELLDIVYHGRVYLDKFEITETDFLMPYVKNGHVIVDVSCASQV